MQTMNVLDSSEWRNKMRDDVDSPEKLARIHARFHDQRERPVPKLCTRCNEMFPNVVIHYWRTHKIDYGNYLERSISPAVVWKE